MLVVSINSFECMKMHGLTNPKKLGIFSWPQTMNLQLHTKWE